MHTTGDHMIMHFHKYGNKKYSLKSLYSEKFERMINMSGCKCAKPTDEFHGWKCNITDGECMFLFPNSKQCAELYGEGPDTINSDDNDVG